MSSRRCLRQPQPTGFFEGNRACRRQNFGEYKSGSCATAGAPHSPPTPEPQPRGRVEVVRQCAYPPPAFSPLRSFLAPPCPTARPRGPLGLRGADGVQDRAAASVRQAQVPEHFEDRDRLRPLLPAPASSSPLGKPAKSFSSIRGGGLVRVVRFEIGDRRQVKLSLRFHASLRVLNDL
jgi:hypothetical protein